MLHICVNCDQAWSCEIDFARCSCGYLEYPRRARICPSCNQRLLQQEQDPQYVFIDAGNAVPFLPPLPPAATLKENRCFCNKCERI